jgi:hypothetical protein
VEVWRCGFESKGAGPKCVCVRERERECVCVCV